MERYQLLPNANGTGPLEYGVIEHRDQEETQVRFTPQFAGPLRIPPMNFQPRVRKEINTRDTVNARHIENWNANTPIQQASVVRYDTSMGIVTKSPKGGPNFNKLADAYRIPTADDLDRFRITIQNASIPATNSGLTKFIDEFMKIVSTYDTNNGLYITGALMDFFPSQTDRYDYLNLAAEREKKGILDALNAFYSRTGAVPGSSDFITNFKNDVVTAFKIQRQKNVNGITDPKLAAMDSSVPESLNTVYQDMAPLSSRTDIRDFRQSKPYDPTASNLSLNPFFDRYDPTRDPRNMVREVRSVVYEPKEADRGIEESERIRERTFTNRYSDEAKTPVALTEWYDLMRPKVDNPEIIYRKQTPLEKMGAGGR
jgi:hypothetical protein